MSMITAYNDLLPLVMQHVPGCESPLILQHIQQSVRRFCHKGESYTEKLQPIDLIEDKIEYLITPSFDCELRRILEVWIRTANDVTNDADGHRLFERDDYTFIRPNILKLNDGYKPKEDVTDGLVVKVMIVPYLTEAGGNAISEDFLNMWSEPIVAGALASLMLIPRTRWMNLDLARYWEGKFIEGVTDAKAALSMEGLVQPEGLSG
jgi:hypothetical protein